MNKSGLVLRLAIAIIFTAVVVGLVTTQVFYRYTFQNEQAAGEQSISQLYNTVLSTASIASYLNDESLAEEVINGLISNDIIETAEIKTDTMVIQSDDYQKLDSTRAFILFSPFQKERKVGTLHININEEFLAAKANEISTTNAIVLAIQALIITTISLLVSHYVITSPIVNIAERLHLIQPGTQDRIDKPRFHNKSEIGILADDVNILLSKAEQQLIKEKSLRDEVEILEARFRMLFENSTSAIALVEPNGDILLSNKTFDTMIARIGLPVKNNYGLYLADLFINANELHQQIKVDFDNDESAAIDLRLSTAKEETIWVKVVVTPLISDDEQDHYQIILHDISKRKKQILLLDQQANYDNLTALLNRQAAENHLENFIKAKTPFALIMLDLNGFKPINDTFGHDAGDEILIHVAKQLTNNVRKADMLSRWGGDEFVIALPNATKETVVLVTQKLIDKIGEPYHLVQYKEDVSVSASMGVSFYPNDQTGLLDLTRSADKAMYRVKQAKSTDKSLYLSFDHDSTCIARTNYSADNDKVSERNA